MLLCDEPTGHLDSDTGERVLDLIDALRDEFRFALIVATHDTNVVARLGRVVELADGAVVRQEVHA
jgi:ABC-type lipoprotein export system ATPase subunit